MLTIAGLSHAYRNVTERALQSISLNIPDGGVYGLLGPNGAGKTTLISLLAGLFKVQSGEIMLDGRPLAGQRTADPAAVALVPQDYAFYPMLSVRENLHFFAGILDLPKALTEERVAEAIAFARLEQVADKRAEQLSGGLRRRLNLAIGLLGRPRLLLLDEPTVGVDPQSRRFLLDAIATLPARGTTVIYTSHYMEEVESLCSRLAILDRGQVLAEGTLDELLGEDGQQMEFQLVAPPPAGLLEQLAAEEIAPLVFAKKVPCTAAVSETLATLAAADCEPLRLHVGRPNLEQVFMRLTQRSLRD